jgi:hypothetical protein
MSIHTSQSTTTPTGLDKDSLTSVNNVLISDNDRSLVWKRRRRIQQSLNKYVDDLKVKQVKNGVEELVRPMKTFRRCGFSMSGWDSVNVSVYGDRSRVSNLIDCGNAHCPYCWMNSSVKKARKVALSLQGAFAHGYQLYFVTFTKEKILEIEKSVAASKDWMESFTKLVKDFSRNRKVAAASYINLEFTIGRTRFQDKDWKNGKSEVFKLHAHNHACIAIHNSDMNQWNDLKKKIDVSYVKFINDRDIATFTDDDHEVSVHWESITHPNEAIAKYFHKVERNVKVSSEVALSNAKKGKFGKNLGLFQALDFMETCSRKNRQAMELTIARTLVAMHGKRGSKTAKSYNFVFRKDAGPLNLGKLGYEMKYKGVKAKIEKDNVPLLQQPQKSSSLFEMIKEYPQHDFTPLVDWAAEALALPDKEGVEVELGWILRSIWEMRQFHEKNWKIVEESRVMKRDVFSDQDNTRSKLAADAINYCSIAKRGTKNLMLTIPFVTLLLRLKKYDELDAAIRQLLLYEVNNITGDWKEHDFDDVVPMDSVKVPSVLWDRLQGQGKAFNLVKRIQEHVRHDAHPLIKVKMSKCVVPHHIDDYIIVDAAFQDLVTSLDL